MSDLPPHSVPAPIDSYHPPSSAGFALSTESSVRDEPLIPASVKPLLNPLQDGNEPSPSVIAQPPRSPNPLNPATDGQGNNVNLPPSLPSTAAPSPAVASAPEAPFPGAGTITPDLPNVMNGDTQLAGQPEQAPSAAPIVDQPPLPIDAPVPPSPQARDEPPPVLPPGAIPPAVPTPDVIITPGREALEEAQQVAAPSEQMGSNLPAEPQLSLPFQPLVPAPAPVEPAPIPAPAPPNSSASAAAAPAEPATEHVSSDAIGEAMDVDAAGEAEEEPKPAVEKSDSTSGVKRSGEDLEGPEEKRLKEEANGSGPSSQPSIPTPAPPAASATSVPMPVIPEGAPRPAWESYQEPIPRPAGPATPLTQTQVKHLLASVRTLKKNPNAFGFLEPVDVVKFGIPHYFNVISKPMDLSTVEMKLIMSDPRGPPKDRSKLKSYTPEMGMYGSVADVVGDVRQIWENTRKFNGKEHVVSQAADKLDQVFEKQLSNLPAEPVVPPPAPQPVAGPSSSPVPAARRPSVSHPPVIHRSSDGAGDRPKREIHAPPPKDLIYSEAATRKPKRRNDPQLQWGLRTLKSLETSTKNYELVSPFLYPVENIVRDLPDYGKIIANPIDLNIIKSKLENGSYDDVDQLDGDIRLMVRNAQQFNPPTHEVHVAAKKLLQLWEEKWAGLPAKVDVREESEDPLAEDDDEVDEEEGLLADLRAKHSRLQEQIDEVEARIAKRKASRSKKSKGSTSKGRKQSTAGRPSGANANGQAKKPKKTKEPRYRDDEESEEEEVHELTSSQKTELAEKIGDVDGPMLEKIIGMIKRATKIPDDSEIELDIDSLPRSLTWQLYKMVVRPDLLHKRRQSGPLKKPGRKPGGPSRNRLDEDREEERIQAMKRQLKELQDGGYDQGGMGQGYDSESSEEESSDEE